MSVYCWHNAQLTISFHLNLILLTWRIWWAPNNASKWQMGFYLAFKELILAAFSVEFRYVSRAPSKFTVRTRQHIHYSNVMSAAVLHTSSISFILYSTSLCYVTMQKWESKLVDTPHGNIRSHNTCDYVTLTASTGSNCLVLSSLKKI
jgi:hypothetical protein